LPVVTQSINGAPDAARAAVHRVARLDCAAVVGDVRGTNPMLKTLTRALGGNISLTTGQLTQVVSEARC
jgi:hypothetical protein